MTDSAPNKTVEERLAGVEAKTDLLRQDLNEFKNETRSGFSAVRADMRDMEVRLGKRQDEATATLRAELRAELKDATDGLRKEFQTTTDGLRKEFQDTTEGLRKEIKNTTDSLRKEIKNTTDSLRKEIKNTTEGLHETTVSLSKEIQNTTEKLSTGMAEVRGYIKGLYVAIVPLTIAVLGLMAQLALRG